MTAEEFLNHPAVAAGVLIAILGFAYWRQTKATNKLFGRQRQILEGMEKDTRELLERMRRGMR
jgi:hypothetical protein